MKILREHIQSNPEILFIFGDNDARTGLGGMAKEFRGEPNTQGIRTKHKPATTDDSYYSDDNLEDNKKKITDDCTVILNRASSYVGVYIPEGIGDGLSKLEELAPKTYNFLKEKIEKLKEELVRRGR